MHVYSPPRPEVGPNDASDSSSFGSDTSVACYGSKLIMPTGGGSVSAVRLSSSANAKASPKASPAAPCSSKASPEVSRSKVALAVSRPKVALTVPPPRANKHNYADDDWNCLTSLGRVVHMAPSAATSPMPTCQRASATLACNYHIAVIPETTLSRGAPGLKSLTAGEASEGPAFILRPPTTHPVVVAPRPVLTSSGRSARALKASVLEVEPRPKDVRATTVLSGSSRPNLTKRAVLPASVLSVECGGDEAHSQKVEGEGDG